MAYIDKNFPLQINRGHPLARDIVACWTMKDGTGGVIPDLCGRWPLTLTAPMTQKGDGTFGKTMYNDSAGGYGTASNATFTFPASFTGYGWSLSLAIFARNQANYNQYSSETGDDWGRFAFHTSSAKTLYMGPNQGANQRFVVTSGMADNTWERYSFVVNRDYISGSQWPMSYFYRNGLRIEYRLTTLSGSPWAGFRIGLNAAASYINGYIAYYYIHNRPLSYGEISLLRVNPYCFIGPSLPRRNYSALANAYFSVLIM